uniref:Uncharacterized protein n=1 Tax=Arundo donax TaxID=35708 RepID=A0A0A9BUA3_ARUDO
MFLSCCSIKDRIQGYMPTLILASDPVYVIHYTIMTAI